MRLLLATLLAWFIVYQVRAQGPASFDVLNRVKPDRIMLRWMPTTPQAWEAANRGGYVLVRTTVSASNGTPSPTKTISLSGIKASDQPAWQPYLNPDSLEYAAIYYMTIGDIANFQVPPADLADTTATPTGTTQFPLDERYVYVTFAANTKFTAAVKAGLGYVDVDVKAGETYQYTISSPGAVDQAGNAVAISSVSVTLAMANFTALPRPVIKQPVQQGKRQVTLAWDSNSLLDTYGSYNIERATNGSGNYQRLNERPYVQLSDSTALQYYPDSLPNKTRSYQYRIIGNSYFNEVQASDPVSVTVIQELQSIPGINKAQTTGGRFEINWRYPLEGSNTRLDTLISNFVVSVSQQDLKGYRILGGTYPYSAMSASVPVATLTALVDTSKSYYVQVSAIGIAGDTLHSLPYQINAQDRTPPGVPQGVSVTDLNAAASNATQHLIRISWLPNTDADILGYRVFRQIGNESEKIEVSGGIRSLTSIVDTLNRNIALPTVTYYVWAFDQNYHQSLSAGIGRFQQPDTKGPMPAVLTGYSPANAGVLIRWTLSPSSQMEPIRHDLLRKEASGTGDWQVVKSLSPGDTLHQYTDQGLTAGTTYVYSLVAYDEAGNASCFKHGPATPADCYQLLLVKAPTSNGPTSSITSFSAVYDTLTNQVKLNWTFSQSTVQVYEIYKARASFKPIAWRTADASTLTLTDDAVEQGLTYVYQIRAVFADGTNTPWAPVTVTCRKSSGTVNQPPVVSTPPTPQFAVVGSPFTYSLADNAFNDPDGQVVSVVMTGNLPTGLIAQGRTLSGTPTVPGSYTVSIVATDDRDARVTATLVVTVDAAVTPPILAGAGTVCVGQSVTLTAANCSGNVRWSTGATGNQLVVVPSQTTSYTAICQTTRQTSGSSQPLLVTVISPPSAPIMANQAICLDGSATLSVSNCPGEVRWSGGFTAPQLTVSPVVTTVYSATCSVAGCVSPVGNVTVTVNNPPSLTLVGNAMICAGQTTTITAQSPGATTYKWSTGATTASLTTNVSGTYSVTVTNASGCSAVDNVEIQSAAAVTPKITGNLAICSGAPTTLVASGGSAYRWSTGATTAAISVSAAGTYSVTVGSGSSCSATTAATVVVSSAPVASIGGSVSVCSGQTTSLTATGGSTYRWSTGATTATISVSAAGTYSVTATSQNGCSAVASTSVITTNCPVSGTYVNCGGPQIIDAQGRTWLADDTDASPYRRTSTGIGTGSIVAGGNQTDAPDALFNTQRYAYNQDFQRWAFPVANGTYQVHLYFAELWDGCQGTGCRVARVYLEEELRESVDINALVGYRHGLRKTYTVTVTDGELYLGLTGTTQSPIISGIAIIPGSATPVTPAPTASITASPGLSICAGQSTSLTASGGDTYRWSTGATTPTISVSAAGPYSVTVTNSGGNANTSVTVVSSPAPTASISGNLTITAGQNTNLTAAGGDAYRWSTGATTATISVSVAGPYSVTATNQAGCSAVASVTVVTSAPPALTAGISGSLSICAGQSTSLTASGGSAYRWSTGATTAAISVSAAGPYSVTVTNGSGGSGVSSVTVVSSPAPTASINGNLTITSGQSTTLTASGGDTYRWSTGAITATISVSVAGPYSVTATSQAGCSAVASAIVVTSAPPALTASINGSLSICAGQSTTLTASGGSTYQWSTGATTAAISVSAAGPYSVTVTDGSSGVASVTVVSNSAPTASIIGSLTITSSQSTTLTASGGDTYRWSTGATTTTISVSVAGPYSVTATTQAGCSAVASTTVTQTASEMTLLLLNGTGAEGSTNIVDSSPNQRLVSVNGNVRISTAQSKYGGSSLFFDGNSYLTIPSSTDFDFATGDFTIECFMYPTATSDYPTIVSRRSNSGGVVWNTNISPNNSGFGLNVTNGDGNFINPGPLASTQFSLNTWYHVALVASAGQRKLYVNGTLVANASSVPSMELNPNRGQILVGAQGSGSNRYQGYMHLRMTKGRALYTGEFTPPATFDATLTPTTAVTASIGASPSLSICAGQSTTLTASGGSAYRWSTGATTAAISVSAAGPYSVTVTNGSGGSGVASVTVVSNSAPTASISGNLTITSGQSTTLTASGGDTYRWSTGAITATISVSVAGPYSVTATSQAGCSAVASATVVTSAPPALTASINGSLSICAGQSTTLTASGGSTYQWSTGATTAAISVSAAGAYSVTVTNGSGGSGVSSVTVVSSLAPVASIGGSVSVCSGQTTSLTATGGSTYRWSTGATTATISVSAAGTYSVTATSQNGCSAVASTSVITTNCPVSGTYVNCGGPQIIDAQGRTWLADDTDASPYRRTSTGIGTGSIVAGGNQTDAPDALFNTQRYAYNQDFQRWAFPVANGTYQVHLYFAELWDGCQGTGCRVARVYLEEELRESVDINALVGYRHGLRKTYTVTVTDGELYLGLTGTTQSPIISGIAIIPQ